MRHFDWQIENCDRVIDRWEAWCGETLWTKYLRIFGELGGKIIWYCGFPQSKSAIPLCFTLVLPNGKELSKGRSRLKDIKSAIKSLREKK